MDPRALRLGFVALPQAALQALARREPGLDARLVAVAHPPGGHGRVVAASEGALRAGVSLGDGVAVARHRCPEVLLRPLDEEALRSAHEALFDAVSSASPRVEPHPEGALFDAAGLDALYGSEGGLCAAVARAAERVGLRVGVGVASSRLLARYLARREGGACEPARERELLRSLPLRALCDDGALLASLERLGLRSVDALLALAPGAVGTRLGPAGALLVRALRGEAEEPLAPRRAPERMEEALTLDWEVEHSEALLFVLRRLLEPLYARASVRGLGVAALGLSLGLRGGVRDERRVPLATPSRDPALAMHVLRALLEGAPPTEAVLTVRVVAEGAPLRGQQLGLFDAPTMEPEKLTLLLARLGALTGPRRVGSPRVADTHRPLAFGVEPFALPEPVERRGAVSEEPGRYTLALHVYRPPREAQVELARERLRYVSAEGVRGAVRSYAGPFRVCGEWWGEPFEHDGYDVELSDGGVYLLGYDRLASAWRVEGVYE